MAERLIGMLIFPRLTQLDMTGPLRGAAQTAALLRSRGAALNEQRREMAQRIGRKRGVSS